MNSGGGRVPDPAELAEDLARIERAVKEGARDTREAIDSMLRRIESTYLRQDVYDAKHNVLVERVGKVEERQTWTARTALTALLLPVVVSVVAAVLLSSGGFR